MAERQIIVSTSEPIHSLDEFTQSFPLCVGGRRKPAKVPISGRGKRILFENSKQSFRRFFRTLHVHNGTKLADIDCNL